MNSFTPFSVMKSVISCMCLVASSLCSIVYMASGGCFADAVRSDRDHLEAWMETTPQQAADIWLRPMLSGTEGPTTVQRPVHICEQQQVARLAKILHSRQSRTAFLGPFGHWGAIRYARLQARMDDGSYFVFAVSWHDTGDVCGFGLLRNTEATRYIAGDIIDVGASDELAKEINGLVLSNRVEWVPAHERQWKASVTNGPIYRTGD